MKIITLSVFSIPKKYDPALPKQCWGYIMIISSYHLNNFWKFLLYTEILSGFRECF